MPRHKKCCIYQLFWPWRSSSFGHGGQALNTIFTSPSVLEFEDTGSSIQVLATESTSPVSGHRRHGTTDSAAPFTQTDKEDMTAGGDADKKTEPEPLIEPIPDRMYPTVIELLPDKIITIPVWDSNHTLVSGGKEIIDYTCAYPILDSTNKKGLSNGCCCLGANSAGGGQIYKGAEETCPQDLPIYRQIQDYTVQCLEAPLATVY